MKPPRRPLIIATEGRKGGTGKSTIAACLGDEAMARGLEVRYLDADRQGSLCAWAASAARHGRRAPRVIAALEPHRETQHFVGCDLVLIDCPGSVRWSQKSALMVADVALLPAMPSPLDGWALKESVKLVRKAQKFRRDRGEDLQLWIVLNGMTRSSIARGTAAMIRGAGAPVCAQELGFRATYRQAIAAGAGPCTYDPTSPAALEVRALFDEVLAHSHMGERHAQAAEVQA